MKTFTVLLFCFTVTAARAQWSVESFGAGQLTQPFEVKVGKARNDGINRVYVTERNGNVTEWTHTGSVWSKTVVATGIKNLALLAIGDARNDGTNRIYYTEYNSAGALHEAEWNFIYVIHN